jgi:hypothetical protein
VTAFVLIAAILAVDPEPFPAGFKEIPLAGVVNADPFGKQDVFYPDVRVSPWPHYAGEAESCAARTGHARVVRADAASAGEALEFPADAPGGAVWYFDLPIYSPVGRLYVRLGRTPAGSGATSLVWTLNGEEIGVTRAPQGDRGFGIVALRLGNLMPGRCVLKCETEGPSDALALDAFWLTDGEAHILNRLDNDGQAMGPASARMLVYEPGLAVAGGVPFRLLDPDEHGGNAVAVSRGEPLQLTLPETVDVAQVHLLLGGRVPSKVFAGEAALRYAGGRVETVAFDIPPLFAERTPLADLALGTKRQAYVVSLPAADEPLTGLALRSDHEHFALLAATAETP